MATRGAATRRTATPARRLSARRLSDIAVIATAVIVTAVVAGSWAAPSRAAPHQSAHTPPAARVAATPTSAATEGTAATAGADVAGRHPVAPQRRKPAYRPCANNRRAQLIVVSIARQHEWACSRQRTVLSTVVTTGASRRPGDATPRGNFAVQGLNRNTRLTTSADSSYDVKYWIPFHLGVWGFHDARWQKIPFGSPRYVTRGSHGCVHMPMRAIRWLFHWVHYGTRVHIT
jgi:lipoprotein-anchoring transpeptidase ErfK/SrfK